MAAMKCLTSLVIASLVLTSMVQGACFRKSVAFDTSPSLAEGQTGLSVYCPYGEERKQLFTAWVDLQACTRCFCLPSGMQCCGMGPTTGGKSCQGRL